MEEYIFKEAPFIDWQKWLNQWKHDYNIEIMDIEIKEETAVLLIKRTLIPHRK